MRLLYLFLILLAFIYLVKVIICLIRVSIYQQNLKKRPAELYSQSELLYIDEGSARENSIKNLHRLADPIRPVLEFWSDPDTQEFSNRVGEELNTLVKLSKNNLRANGMRRRLIVSPYDYEVAEKGKIERKWDDGGLEWRASDLKASLLEEYYSLADDSLLASYYYHRVCLTPLMSRRLRENEKQAANARDKWGRKIETKNFYEDEHITVCPSCGGRLPSDLKDQLCPYCNATIFSDYYDWQLEDMAIEPDEIRIRTLTGFVIWLFSYQKIGKRVVFKVQNQGRHKISRFSENAFRSDLYRSCIEHSDADRLVDLWLGKIEILGIQNTRKDTILKVRVPVFRTMISPDGGIGKEKEILKTSFIRSRYPNKFDQKNAVISTERACPYCGSEFKADEKGCCIHCGSFLYKDNTHWKRM